MERFRLFDTPRRVTEMKIPFAEYALSGDQLRRLPWEDISTLPIFPRALRKAQGLLFRDRISQKKTFKEDISYDNSISIGIQQP